MTAPRTRTELLDIAGDVRADGSQIVYPGGQSVWEQRHMIVLRDLPLVAPRPLYAHRAMADALRGALQEWSEVAPEYLLETIGCFCPRPRRTCRLVSFHAMGLAVDINAARNPLAEPGCPLVTDLPSSVVAAFERRGFTWGGRWHRPDAMHFQYGDSSL